MANLPEDRTDEEIRDAIKIDGDAVRGHLDEQVRSTVEETLNKMLDAEADQICNAKRYESGADCQKGLTQYFKFYSHERPHQSLGNRPRGPSTPASDQEPRHPPKQPALVVRKLGSTSDNRSTTRQSAVGGAMKSSWRRC
ncbi:integrase core domain-containing protein [Blastopirellula sp. J2-11]|uniref:integrase core domain-containing protein n=1 Tax=Blastopirellula sp. J2-11 TaxID=2943192 RepID=UPI0021C988B8|nr:integrase core domain-containing protein [Blastopirellula sp. J2-11]UUO04533.1 integrase core domain-containing protein [Blastopirellula sp. J2-11]